MAATDPQLYSLVYLLADGALLSEEASVSIAWATGSSEAKTVAKGYAGETPGAPMTEMDVTSMVPAAGVEFNPIKYMKSMIPAEMGVLAFGQQMTVKGFIVGASLKHSVNSESAFDFKFRAAMADFE